MKTLKLAGFLILIYPQLGKVYCIFQCIAVRLFDGFYLFLTIFGSSSRCIMRLTLWFRWGKSLTNLIVYLSLSFAYRYETWVLDISAFFEFVESLLANLWQWLQQTLISSMAAEGLCRSNGSLHHRLVDELTVSVNMEWI